MSINWIPVGTRVPDSRRPVLTWGHTLMHSRPEGRFLGVAKCNIGRNGHRFDNEVSGFLPAPRVTHWADIESPPYTPPKLPAPPGVPVAPMDWVCRSQAEHRDDCAKWCGQDRCVRKTRTRSEPTDGVAPSDQTKESKHGRLDEFRPTVRGGMVVGGDAGRPVAGSKLSSVADKLWASEAVMSLNAELGLTLDQLVRLAKAIVSAGVSGDGNAQP